MNPRFLLFTQPRWIGFKLTQEGQEEERDFDSIPAAFAYVRAIPEAQGAPFVVFDEQGREFASLTV